MESGQRLILNATMPGRTQKVRPGIDVFSTNPADRSVRQHMVQQGIAGFNVIAGGFGRHFCEAIRFAGHGPAAAVEQIGHRSGVMGADSQRRGMIRKNEQGEIFSTRASSASRGARMRRSISSTAFTLFSGSPGDRTRPALPHGYRRNPSRPPEHPARPAACPRSWCRCSR